MGILEKGILGGFTGKVGDMVGSSWKGIPVVRKRPVRRLTGFSQAEIERRARFVLLMDFFNPIAPVLKMAFDKSRLKMTGVNKAISLNKDVVTGIYPHFRMDYPKVILCNRICQNEDPVTVGEGNEGKLIFAVNKNAVYGKSGSRLFFIAAYEERLGKWIYKLNPAKSNDLSFELDLTPFRQKNVHTYAGFMPVRGINTVSLYNGMIMVP